MIVRRTAPPGTPASIGPSGAAHPTLFQRLHIDGSFLKDTRLGRIFHPRQLSLREHVTRDSLHVTIGEDNRLHAHIDTVSPVAGRTAGGVARYSLPRVVLHNAWTIAERLVHALQGERHPPGCELECDLDPDGAGADPQPRGSEPSLAAQAAGRIEAAFGFR